MRAADLGVLALDTGLHVAALGCVVWYGWFKSHHFAAAALALLSPIVFIVIVLAGPIAEGWPTTTTLVGAYAVANALLVVGLLMVGYPRSQQIREDAVERRPPRLLAGILAGYLVSASLATIVMAVSS